MADENPKKPASKNAPTDGAAAGKDAPAAKTAPAADATIAARNVVLGVQQNARVAVKVSASVDVDNATPGAQVKISLTAENGQVDPKNGKTTNADPAGHASADFTIVFSTPKDSLVTANADEAGPLGSDSRVVKVGP
jgi:hypothetical protein